MTWAFAALLARVIGIQPIAERLAARLDAAWSARLDSLESRLTAARAANLDAAISGRAPAATAVSKTDYTNARAVNVNANVAPLAPASTAASNLDFTAARASNLDSCDALPSSMQKPIKSIRRGAMYLNSYKESDTYTVSPAVDPDKTLLFEVGQAPGDNGWIANLGYLNLVDGSTIEFVRALHDNINYNSDVWVQFLLVEFNS